MLFTWCNMAHLEYFFLVKVTEKELKTNVKSDMRLYLLNSTNNSKNISSVCFKIGREIEKLSERRRRWHSRPGRHIF